MKESCHVSMSHVTYQWVMSRINESCPMWTAQGHWRSCPPASWVVSHVSHLNESRAYLIWMSCVMSHINEACHMRMSHIRLWTTSKALIPCLQTLILLLKSEFTHLGKKKPWMIFLTWLIASIVVSHVMYEWFMSHMNESCHVWISHVT